MNTVYAGTITSSPTPISAASSAECMVAGPVNPISQHVVDVLHGLGRNAGNRGGGKQSRRQFHGIKCSCEGRESNAG